MFITFICLIILIPFLIYNLVPGGTTDEKIDYLEGKLEELEKDE